jgi:ABC-type bacteriocin/lantibiotic exporter with double-glycine peptidase domain
MLILDEATSALDAATERQVMDSIVESRPDITVIMIAHRPASLGFCDRILRLEGRALTTVSSADATQRDVPLGAGH